MSAASKTKSVCRSVSAFALIANFFLSAIAQTAPDTREQQLALAIKQTKEAVQVMIDNDMKSVPLAITKLQSAEQIFGSLGEKAGQMRALFALGHFQFVLDQKDPGVATLNRALALARELNDQEQQVRILGRLGEYLFKDGKAKSEDRDQARAYVEEATTVIEKMDPKPDPLSYDTYDLFGRIWESFYHMPNAQKAYLDAYRLVMKKPPEESIPAMIKYAKHVIDLGYPYRAVAPLDTARRRSIAAKLPELEALATWCIGDLMAGKFRDLPTAKKYLDLTEQLLKQNPDEALQAKVNLSWGKYYYATFDLAKSAEYFRKAYNPEARTTPVGLKGEILLHIGILNYTIGSFEQAIPLLEEAAKINGAENRKLMEMESLRYLARSQNALGRTAEAQKTMAQAMGARGASGQSWTSSESVAVLIDDSDFFIESFQRNPGKVPATDNRLGRAKWNLELALRTADREKMTEYRTVAAQRLALVYLLRGDTTKPLGLLNDALTSARTAGLPVQEATALAGLMEVSFSTGNTGAATFFGKSAVNIYQQLRKKIADITPEERTAYLHTIEGTYRKLVSLLIKQGRIPEAEQVLTLLKEEELMEYVRRDDAVANSMLQTLTLTEDERSAITRYATIADQITALGKELEALEKESRNYDVDKFPKQTRLAEVRKLIADASTTFEKFLDGLKLKFGEDNKTVAQVDSGLKSLLAELNEPRTAIVSTIVGNDSLNIIVTTSRTQRAHTVKVSEEQINDLVGKFRTALTSPQYDPRPIGQQLYDLIVKPIETDLAGIKADKILWSFDGTLRYIPPAALWDKKNGYLVERFENVMINLASQKGLDKPRTPRQPSALGVGVSKPVEGFSALTAVPDELDCIVSDKTVGILSAKPQCASGVLPGRKLLDDKFTLASFEGELGRYPIVHIASHFKLTPGDNKNSFLLLGGGDERKFTVEKLRGESQLTGIDLIVLSACNTATPGGTKANGLEVEGFASIAQKVGAKSVIATLWSVADSSTKDFMVEFYTLYGKEGLSKADAMRKAQLKLMYGKYSADEALKHRSDDFVTATNNALPKFTPDPNAPFAHPFYWSPFVLTGNWQ